MSTLSGKIKRKIVRDGRVSFLVGSTWISAFTVGQYVTDEMKELLRDLAEGDSAEFTIVEKTGKDGKVYHNISGAIRVQQILDEPPAEDVQPAGHKAVMPKGDADDIRIRSMALAYAKDWAIGQNAQGEESYSTTDILEVSKRFEQYIKTGE